MTARAVDSLASMRYEALSTQTVNLRFRATRQFDKVWDTIKKNYAQKERRVLFDTDRNKGIIKSAEVIERPNQGVIMNN